MGEKIRPDPVPACPLILILSSCFQVYVILKISLRQMYASTNFLTACAMKITTKMIEDEVYEAVTKDGILAKIDMRSLPEKQNQSPVELILSSLSACGAVDIVAMLKKRRKNIDAFVIETEGSRRDEVPRSFTAIHCRYIITSANVTEDELNKVAKLSLEKYCSVAASLNATITFSVAIIKPD
jgi:putative redox protein